MIPYRTIIYFIIAFIFLFGCSLKNKELQNNQNFHKKHFAFPDSVLVVKDSALCYQKINNLIDLSRSTLVVIVWGDCHICMKKINLWEDFISSYDLYDFQILIVVTTKSPEYFIRVFKPELTYNGILVIDNNNCFYNLNNLSVKNIAYHTFLLDTNGEICLVGDPFVFPELEIRYLNKMKTCNE